MNDPKDKDQDKKRDQVLERMLRTPPDPKKSAEADGKRSKKRVQKKGGSGGRAT